MYFHLSWNPGKTISVMFLITINKKREIRARYLSHSSGLRTHLSVKISNFEAHADMCTITICPVVQQSISHLCIAHPEDIYRCLISYGISSSVRSLKSRI